MGVVWELDFEMLFFRWSRIPMDLFFMLELSFSFLFLSDVEHLYWWRCLFFEIPGVLAKQVAFGDSKSQCLLALLLDNLLTAVLFITHNGCFWSGYSGSLMSSKSRSVCHCLEQHPETSKSNGIFYVQKFCFEVWSLDACIIETVKWTGESGISFVPWNPSSFNSNKNHLIFSQFNNSSYTQHLKWQLYSWFKMFVEW